jgi:hypothetical protein
VYKVRDHLTLTTWANHGSCSIRNTVIYYSSETVMWWNPASTFPPQALSLYWRSTTALTTCALFRTPSSFTVCFCIEKFCCTVAFYCCSWACSYAHKCISASSPSQCAIVSPLSLPRMLEFFWYFLMPFLMFLRTPRLGFFLRILWCSQSGDHPEK